MSRALLLALLAPGVAGATSPAWFAQGGEAEIAARLEVPLYAEPDGRLLVVATFGEGDDAQQAPLRIALSDATTVPAGLVDALGLKAKGAGETVKIPVLRLGDAVLRDVRARVGDEAVLAVGNLSGVAVAVRPSAGTLVVAPAAEADALLSEVGTAVTATVEGQKAWWYHGGKRAGDALSWQVEGEVFGAVGVFRIGAGADTTLGGDVTLTAAMRRGGEIWAYGPATVAGVALPATLFHMDQSLVGRDGNLLGELGADALAGLDWAVDPATRRFAAGAHGTKAGDPSEALIAVARADFARAEAEAAEAEAEKKAPKKEPEAAPEEGASQEAAPEDAAAVGRHTDLAEALWAGGQRAEALEHYKAAAANAGERCGPHLTLGRRLLQDGDASGALTSLQQAAAAWDRWYAQDLEVRERVSAGRSIKADVFDVEQSTECYEAWGELAAARFAQGSFDEVRAIARTHRELDPLPWQLSGMAGLVEGDPKAANADLRQALQLGARQDAWALLALGWASTGLDRPDAVRGQVGAVHALPDPIDFPSAFAASQLTRQALGDTGAVEQMAALVAARPESAPAQLGLALAQRAAGHDATAAIAAASALAEADVARRPGDDAAIAWAAVATALGSDPAAAATRLAAVTAPESADWWLASGLVKAMTGDLQGSADALSGLVARFPIAPVPVNWAEPVVGDAP